MSGDISITVVGDCIINHRLSVYKDPQFLSLVELLRDSDFSVANMEVCITQGEDPPALVAAGGATAGYQGVPPFCVEELKWLGFNSVWTANNHAQDFGEGGIATTLKYLDQYGLGHAGTGRTMTEATAPTYTDTPNGRVGLMGVCDWGPRYRADLPYPIPLGALASDPTPVFKGRPGVNLLRYDPVHHVDKHTLDALRRASQELGWEKDKAVRRIGAGGRAHPLVSYKQIGREVDTDTEFYFMGTKFVEDEKFTFETVPYEVDLERNYRWVREAAGQSDIAVVGLHQQGAGRSFEEPLDHTSALAHGAIDNGADFFVGHGRGRLGGIEIYKGKPIIYGLPGFIMQLNQVRHVPPEVLERSGLPREATALEFLEARDANENSVRTEVPNPGGFAAVTAVFDRTQRSLKEIRVFPIATTQGSRAQSGRPLLAEPGSDVANRVLESVTSLSANFGTAVQTRDGVAYVRP